MSQMKQQSSKRQFIDDETNKLSTTSPKKIKSISDIEDLSNEIFYEIFDYLDGCHIFKAFFNLNTRFQCIITSSSILLKIKLCNELDSIVQSYCEHVIIPNRHRIISLHLFNSSLMNTFFTFCTINSSFNRLESLVLCGVDSDQIMLTLLSLRHLSCLRSLTIVVPVDLIDFHPVYQLVFTLPSLKYFKLFLYKDRSSLTIPIVTGNQFSDIEHLVIDHSCNLNKLIAILSCTPRLSRLTCDQLYQSDEDTARQTLVTLSDLTHFKIYRCHLPFDTLEVFITKLSSQLQMLYIGASSDAAYLDAKRWKRLVSKHMPYLFNFYLRHHGTIDINFEPTLYQERINQFTSAFWIKRQWIFEVRIDIEQSNILSGSFSIHIQKKHEEEFCKSTENVTNLMKDTPSNIIRYTSISNEHEAVISSIQYYPDMILTVNSFDYTQINHGLDNRIISLFLTTLKFTHLIVNNSGLSVIALSELIRLFHNVESLTVSSSLQFIPRRLSVEEERALRLASHINEITKVILMHMTDHSQVDFFMDLCSSIKHLQVSCAGIIDVQSLVRFILMKNIKQTMHLVSLRLCIRAVNKEIIEELQKMINLEKLLSGYTIEHSSNDRIDLRWKKE